MIRSLHEMFEPSFLASQVPLLALGIFAMIVMTVSGLIKTEKGQKSVKYVFIIGFGIAYSLPVSAFALDIAYNINSDLFTCLLSSGFAMAFGLFGLHSIYEQYISKTR